MIVFYTRLASYTYFIFFFQFCFSQEAVAQVLAHSVYNSEVDIQNNSRAQLFVSRNFQAIRADNQDTRLFWQTAYETSSSYVEIERSFDNRDFQTIAIMFGPEDLQHEENSYEYRDKDVKHNRTGAIYYRLKLITGDGDYKYSPVKSIHWSEESKVQMAIFPLPCTETLQIHVEYSESRNAELKICTVTGDELRTQKITLRPGRNSIRYDNLASLGSGVYLLKLTGSGQLISSQEIVIQ